jgi:hypothetical protein
MGIFRCYHKFDRGTSGRMLFSDRGIPVDSSFFTGSKDLRFRTDRVKERISNDENQVLRCSVMFSLLGFGTLSSWTKDVLSGRTRIAGCAIHVTESVLCAHSGSLPSFARGSNVTVASARNWWNHL